LRFSYGAIIEIFSFLYTCWDIIVAQNQKKQIKITTNIFLRIKTSDQILPAKRRYVINIVELTHPKNIKPKSQIPVFKAIAFFQKIVAKPEKNVERIPQIIYVYFLYIILCKKDISFYTKVKYFTKKHLWI